MLRGGLAYSDPRPLHTAGGRGPVGTLTTTPLAVNPGGRTRGVRAVPEDVRGADAGAGRGGLRHPQRRAVLGVGDGCSHRHPGPVHRPPAFVASHHASRPTLNPELESISTEHETAVLTDSFGVSTSLSARSLESTMRACILPIRYLSP